MALRAVYNKCFGRKARQYGANEDGVTSIEFALLSIPYFLIITGIIEIGMISMSSSTLQTGVREAGRMTRVGLGGCMTKDDYKELICEASAFLPECESRLNLKRETFSTGWENAESDLANPDLYQNVSGGDVVLMTAAYDWDVLTPMMQPILGASGGTFTFVQSFAFQNEGWNSERCEDGGGS